MLPSGLLKSVRRREATPTDKPFQGLSPEALATRLKQKSFSKFKAAKGGHFVYLYQCQEPFYQATRDILESLYDGVTGYLEQWEVPKHAPEVPLVVLIFPDRKTFDAYHKMPPEILAYYSTVSNFIVLHEDPELSDAAPEFALKQAAYTIAHEGIHQILGNMGIHQRLARWPAWLCEGMPELFCPIKVTSTLVKEGSSSMPTRRLKWSKLGLVNDIRMHSLLGIPASGGAVVSKTVSSASLDSAGYAVAWGLAFYLSAKQPQQFQELVREAAAIEPFADLGKADTQADAALFVKHFGDDFAGLEGEVAKYLNSGRVQAQYRDPAVNQKHYVVVHSVKQGKQFKISVYITTSPGGARTWKSQQENNKEAYPANARHSFRTEVCDNRNAAELIVSRIGGSR